MCRELDYICVLYFAVIRRHKARKPWRPRSRCYFLERFVHIHEFENILHIQLRTINYFPHIFVAFFKTSTITIFYTQEQTTQTVEPANITNPIFTLFWQKRKSWNDHTLCGNIKYEILPKAGSTLKQKRTRDFSSSATKTCSSQPSSTFVSLHLLWMTYHHKTSLFFF